MRLQMTLWQNMNVIWGYGVSLRQVQRQTKVEPAPLRMDTALEGSGEEADRQEVVNGGEEDSGKGVRDEGEGSLMEGCVIVDGLMKEESSRLMIE